MNVLQSLFELFPFVDCERVVLRLPELHGHDSEVCVDGTQKT